MEFRTHSPWSTLSQGRKSVDLLPSNGIATATANQSQITRIIHSYFHWPTGTNSAYNSMNMQSKLVLMMAHGLAMARIWSSKIRPTKTLIAMRTFAHLIPIPDIRIKTHSHTSTFRGTRKAIDLPPSNGKSLRFSLRIDPNVLLLKWNSKVWNILPYMYPLKPLIFNVCSPLNYLIKTSSSLAILQYFSLLN